MNGEYILLGDFKGKFFTQQSAALDSVDIFPEDLRHDVRIYSGSLKNASVEKTYTPEKIRKHGSFLLLNVPKVEVSSDEHGTFKESKVYNFTQLLLIEPKVVKTYELNGKTYGEIESKAYGITERYPLVNTLDPDKQDNPPPPLVGEDFVSGDAPVNNTPPFEETFNKARQGCGSMFGGCLANIWQIILLLLLLLLMLFLYKSCRSTQDQCELKEKLEIKLKQEKIRRDSVKIEYDRNLKNAISGYGTIYFFRNSADFHINSMGNNSPISRIYKLMEAYNDRYFVIEGYHTGMAIENTPKLDYLRANHMRDSLIMMGIDSKRLSIRARADSALLDPTCKLSRFFINQSEFREYNRNMRIEVKIDTLNGTPH
jgi:hypothetical protein